MMESEERAELTELLKRLAMICQGDALEKGFHEGYNDLHPADIWKNDFIIPRWLALVHTEVSEAIEAHRENDLEGFYEELADIFIRLFDDIGCLSGTDLFVEALFKKIEKNRTREQKHGKRY